MNNYQIADQFSMLAKLMDIHGENSFRSKTYSIAAYNIEKCTDDLAGVTEEKIFTIQGIGEATGKKIIEFLQTGKIKTLDDLIKKTPQGVLEMLNIKGIGPKKISIIWKEMGLENIGELLYACHENRLLLYKGFGKKTQDNVIDSINFYEQHQGNYLFAQIENSARELEAFLQRNFPESRLEITGDFIRNSETIGMLEFVSDQPPEKIVSVLSMLEDFALIEQDEESLLYLYNDTIKVRLHVPGEDDFNRKLFLASGSKEFAQAFLLEFPAIDFKNAKDDADIFKQLGVGFVPHFLRESPSIIGKAKENSIPEVIQPHDIKGIIHSHSNWSDGVNTLQQMAEGAIEAGLEYLVISDHSKTATYANGLTEDKLKAQHEMIGELNEKLAPFKIFKSIESDILGDGSLDYTNNMLSTFDLVIASVHSNLKMTEEKAMARLIRAIENPFTTILGHMTGRLLLSRRGFPVDHHAIIDACAANDVVIELNAHPRRLDMRWQWLEYALEKNVLISINPDAHSIPEFKNTRYGVLAAQKGGLTKEQNLSSFGLEEFENFLAHVRLKKFS